MTRVIASCCASEFDRWMVAAWEKVCLQMAQDQDGLLSVAQALRAGATEGILRKRVAQGRLTRELPGVLAVAGSPKTWHRKIRAATMWGGPGCAASHRSAARLIGLRGFRYDRAEISITRWKCPDRLAFADGERMVVHRVDERVLPEIRHIDGIPVTSARRTLFDLAGMRHGRAEAALDLALSGGLVDLGQLWLLHDMAWMHGRRGMAIMRGLLVERTTGRAPTHSDLELLLDAVIRDYRLPTPARQHAIQLPFGTIHADFAYPEDDLVIEVDGYAYHGNRRAFEEDRERDNELRAAGWTVLRFTWAMLRYQPERVAELIAQSLASPPTAHRRSA